MHLPTYDENDTYAYDVFQYQQYLFIAGDSHGLITLNIVNPPSPRILTVKENNCEYNYGVFVKDKYAYLSSLDTFYVVDISNPSSPTEVSKIDVIYSSEIYVQGNYAYLPDDTLLTVIDISNPASPVIVAREKVESPWDVFVRDNYAYIVGYDTGLVVIDLANMTNPVKEGSMPTGGSAHSICVSGNYAYLAADHAGLWVISIGNSEMPVFVSVPVRFNEPFYGGRGNLLQKFPLFYGNIL